MDLKQEIDLTIGLLESLYLCQYMHLKREIDVTLGLLESLVARRQSICGLGFIIEAIFSFKSVV